MISKLLGRTQVQTTACFTHRAADSLKTAAERLPTNIAALMDGELPEIIRLRT